MTDKQSLLRHLEDLRKVFIKSFIFIGGGVVVCYFFNNIILDFLQIPIAPFLKETSGKLIFTHPAESFLTHLKVAFWAGFIISAPFWLQQVWGFIVPGLYKKEKKAFSVFLTLAVFLFLAGVAFIYFIIYPLAFQFLLQFGEQAAYISMQSYISFLISTSLGCGLIFQMPLIFVVLARLGVMKAKILRKYRKHAIVGLALVTAFITPPDVLSLLIMGLPVYGLYELSIILVSYNEKSN